MDSVVVTLVVEGSVTAVVGGDSNCGGGCGGDCSSGDNGGQVVGTMVVVVLLSLTCFLTPRPLSN